MRRSALHDAQCMLHVACRSCAYRSSRTSWCPQVCSVSANPTARTRVRSRSRARAHPPCPPIRRRLLWCRAFPSLAGTARLSGWGSRWRAFSAAGCGGTRSEDAALCAERAEPHGRDDPVRAYAHCGAPHIRAVPCCAVAWLALPCGAVLCERHRAVMSALWSLEPSRFRYGRFGDDDVIAWDDSNVEGPPKVCHPYSIRRAPVHVLWYNLHPTPVTTSTFRARDDGGAGPARLRRPDRSHLSCSVQRTPMMQHATYTCHTTCNVLP